MALTGYDERKGHKKSLKNQLINKIIVEKCDPKRGFLKPKVERKMERS